MLWRWRRSSLRDVARRVITKALAAEALQRRVLLYDKKGEQHYDIISALHKSVRNSRSGCCAVLAGADA